MYIFKEKLVNCTQLISDLMYISYIKNIDDIFVFNINKLITIISSVAYKRNIFLASLLNLSLHTLPLILYYI